MVVSVDPTRAGSVEGSEVAEVAQLRHDLLAELESVALCEALAALERNAKQKSVYLQAAAVRYECAESLAARLRSAGAPMPRIRISPRMRLVAKFLRFLGGGYVIPIFTVRAIREPGADPPLVMRRVDSEPS